MRRLAHASATVVVLALAATAAGCAPAPATGPVTRARVEPEPSGPHCANGGLAICTGVDLDGDHALDDTEVTAVTHLCKLATPPECPEGQVVHGPVTLPAPPELLRDATCIDGDLLILGTEDIDVPGLADLAAVTGHVVIAGNPNLEALDGLRQLRDVGGTYLIQGNDALADLTGVGSLAHAAELAIIANAHLPDLSGLDKMTTAPGAITIAGNGELASLTGLDHLTTAGALAIRANPALDSLAALAGLTTTGALDISGNPALAALELRALAIVGGDLVVSNDGALTSLALPALSTIGGTATIEGDAALTRLELPALQAVGGLRVMGDAALAKLALPAVGALGDVELAQLPVLQAVDLRGAQAIDRLTLRRVGLADLSGFALHSLGELVVEACSALRDFQGLGALTSLRTLAVTGSAVHSLTGLDQLETVTGDLTMRNNAIDPVQVRAFVKRVHVEGKVSID